MAVSWGFPGRSTALAPGEEESADLRSRTRRESAKEIDEGFRCQKMYQKATACGPVQILAVYAAIVLLVASGLLVFRPYKLSISHRTIRLNGSQQVVDLLRQQQHILAELQHTQHLALAALIRGSNHTEQVVGLAPAAGATLHAVAEQCKQHPSVNNGSLRLLDNSPYFTPVISAMHDVLTTIGVPHEVFSAPALNDDGEHVYLTCMAHEPDVPTGKRFIVYNFEQLEGRGLLDKKQQDPNSQTAIFRQRLMDAELVLDYSVLNVKFLKERLGVSAVHVPYGFVPRFDGHLAHQNRDINIIFFGEINEDRRKKLQRLAALPHAPQPDVHLGDKCYGSAWLFQGKCWGTKQHHAVYDRSKVAINIHYYTGKTILEVHRLIPLIANRVVVVSERSDDPWYDEHFQDLVTFTDGPADMARKVKTLLDMPPAFFERLAEERYQLLRANLNYKDFVLQSGLFLRGGCQRR